MTIWDSPWAFVFVIALAVVLFLVWLWRKEKWGYLRFSSLKAVRSVPRGIRARLSFLPFVLKAVAIVIAIAALARPQKADEKVKKNIEGIDIMVTLDISESMLIEDMKPANRLESAKKTIEEFVQQRVSDRIGLVVFSGESYTRVPLTLDYDVLLGNLKQVKTSRSIKMGTAIGVALASAASRLKDSEAKSKVVVLLTDGENNTGLIDPLTALRIAKDFDIRIYTIGVGIDGQAKLPIFTKDVFGRTIKRYQPMHSKVNVSLLGQLAKETGGKFYRASNTKSLKNVFTDINDLEKTKIDVNRYVRYQELFQNWLVWAVAIYVLGGLLQLTVLRRGL